MERSSVPRGDGTTEIVVSVAGEKPNIGDFLTPSIASIGIAIVQEGIKAYNENKPYLYAIEKGTIIKMYAMVKKK